MPNVNYRRGDYYGDGMEYDTWFIEDESGVAAELYVAADSREIMQIDVRADRRREGLARMLYETASLAGDVYHAPVAHRSEGGHAFAEAVGGPTAEYPCECTGCSE